MSDYKSSLNANVQHIDRNIRIAFVTAEFNKKYTKKLETVTDSFLSDQGFTNVSIYHVPGAFEIPALTKQLLSSNTFDLIYCFGVVIRGDTPHFDYICTECSRALMDLSIHYPTPLIFGILTCNLEEQVTPRITENYGIAGLNMLGEIQQSL